MLGKVIDAEIWLGLARWQLAKLVAAEQPSSRGKTRGLAVKSANLQQLEAAGVYMDDVGFLAHVGPGGSAPHGSAKRTAGTRGETKL